MSEIYDATYQAVRSRIGFVDLGEVARQAFDISHVVACLQQEFSVAAGEMHRPCVIYRAELTQDEKGGQWSARYDQLAGYGDTPAAAMDDFDKKWRGLKP